VYTLAKPNCTGIVVLSLCVTVNTIHREVFAMASVVNVLGEALGETLLGPILLGGVVVSLAASPEIRKRARQLGVKGIAAAMAATDVARREIKSAGAGTGSVVGQIARRMVQAGSGVREEWEDFIAEAQAAREERKPAGSRETRSGNKSGNGPAAVNGAQPHSSRGRTRRSTAGSRSRRSQP
jgi:hypothetical protein